MTHFRTNKNGSSSFSKLFNWFLSSRRWCWTRVHYASKNPGVFTDARCYQLHALDRCPVQDGDATWLSVAHVLLSGVSGAEGWHWVECKLTTSYKRRGSFQKTAEQKNCLQFKTWWMKKADVGKHVTSEFCDWSQEMCKVLWRQRGFSLIQNLPAQIFLWQDNSNNCGSQRNCGGAVLTAPTAATGLCLCSLTGLCLSINVQD